MNLMNLEAYYSDLRTDLAVDAEELGETERDAFGLRFIAALLDEGVLTNFAPAQYQSPRNDSSVDGFGGDPQDSPERSLDIVLFDPPRSAELETLTLSELEKLFARARRFIERSLNEGFRAELEESSDAYFLADLIATRWEETERVRLFLLSGRRLSDRIADLPMETFLTKELSRNVWDIRRLFEVERGPEALVVSLEDFGGGVSALSAHLDGAQYQAFLAVVPGLVLAKIYDKWGARLLEKNVRVYLQAKGRKSVNAGILKTIDESPEQFFAYNNGITATADHVEFDELNGTAVIRRLENFQIVNGGQTTASLHRALRAGKTEQLARVFVQMKLAVANADNADEMSQRISEYANLQNKVQLSDFGANHPLQRALELKSRRITVGVEGSARATKWFYERTRGQYLLEKGRSPSRDFERTYPRSQVFTKLEMAKYETAWRCEPSSVGQGAQKNFARYMEAMKEKFQQNDRMITDRYFKHAVSKAILYRRAEWHLASNKRWPEWYKGGYRANIVAYGVAKMSREATRARRVLDFDRVWEKQSVPPEAERFLLECMRVAHAVLFADDRPTQNISEWAKSTACWTRVEGEPLSGAFELEAFTVTENVERDRAEQDELREKDIGIVDEYRVAHEAGPEFWHSVYAWARPRRILRKGEDAVLLACAGLKAKPDADVAQKGMNVYRRLRKLGCDVMLPVIEPAPNPLEDDGFAG